MPTVSFTYLTGVAGAALAGVKARLLGSWDATGRYATTWLATDMPAIATDDGCPGFQANVELTPPGTEFQWGVELTFPDGRVAWGIPTEVLATESRQQVRSFQLTADGQPQTYYLTHSRRLGANKMVRPQKPAGIRFAAWASNAQNVEVVMGTIWDKHDPNRTPQTTSLPRPDLRGGYIDAQGGGVQANWGPFAMQRDATGVWQTSPTDPGLQDFAAFDHRPYMYRVHRSDGSVAYRTDLYSRCQLGYGTTDPALTDPVTEAPPQIPYLGPLAKLAGLVSCSAVVDPDLVTSYFQEVPPYKLTPPNTLVWPEREFKPVADFWADEFTAGRPLPTRVEDLIIYELHLGALGFGQVDADGQPSPGTLADAIALLDYLMALGVNAVELLPMAEYEGGGFAWGYATSHYFAIEYAGGGARPVQIFRQGLPPAGHRGALRRGIQPLCPRRRPGRVGLRQS